MSPLHHLICRGSAPPVQANDVICSQAEGGGFKKGGGEEARKARGGTDGNRGDHVRSTHSGRRDACWEKKEAASTILIRKLFYSRSVVGIQRREDEFHLDAVNGRKPVERAPSFPGLSQFQRVSPSFGKERLMGNVVLTEREHSSGGNELLGDGSDRPQLSPPGGSSSARPPRPTPTLEVHAH